MDTTQHSDLEQRGARLWHEIANMRFVGRHSCGTQVHPGYIGPAYRSKGLLLIGMKRGGTTDNRDDTRVLADIKASSSLDAYRALNENVLQAIMTIRWPLVRHIRLVLDELGLLPEAVANINAIPFQVHSTGKALSDLYKDVWMASTRRQVDLINPGAVVFLGKGVWEAIGENIKVPSTYVSLERGSDSMTEVKTAMNRNGFNEKALASLAL